MSDKKLFLAVLGPGGERVLVAAAGPQVASAHAADAARANRVDHSRIEISAATQADVDEGGFLAIVE